MVNALSIGISFKDFWSMTPHEIMLVLEGFKQQQDRETEMQNMLMYIQGRYFADAIMCTVGNMFSKKGAKAISYPKEPYDLHPDRELTEAEKQKQVEMIFTNLERMKTNFENAHNKGGN